MYNKPMDEKEIRVLCSSGQLLFTAHCLSRMQERSILIDDIISVIMNGEIIEDYPDDYPFPSCLVMGTIDKMKLHVVLANDGGCLRIISAYRPDDSKFMEDGKTRR